MRLSHPIVFVVGIAAVLLFFVAIALMKTWRALSWPRERKRRASWAKSVAIVESSTRVTDAGDFLLVLVLAGHADDAGYRDAAPRVKLRGIARLPDAAVAWMERARELPVRVAPSSKHHIAIDLHAIVGDAGDAVERAAYMQRGPGTWAVIT